jgi:hypothetical protein
LLETLENHQDKYKDFLKMVKILKDQISIDFEKKKYLTFEEYIELLIQIVANSTTKYLLSDVKLPIDKTVLIEEYYKCLKEKGKNQISSNSFEYIDLVELYKCCKMRKIKTLKKLNLIKNTSNIVVDDEDICNLLKSKYKYRDVISINFRKILRYDRKILPEILTCGTKYYTQKLIEKLKKVKLEYLEDIVKLFGKSILTQTLVFLLISKTLLTNTEKDINKGFFRTQQVSV